MEAKRAQDHIDGLAKPPGSLGRLEFLYTELCRTQGTLQPLTKERMAVLFAGDHGVVESGVSAWTSEVTRAMIATILQGRSASAVLAKEGQVPLRLVDVGSKHPVLAEEGDRYRLAPLCAGTADLSKGPAMELGRFQAAIEIGREEARRALDSGCRLLIAGEMGIGNTTAATCTIALLTGQPALGLVGPGAGANPSVVSQKQTIVCEAVERVQPIFLETPLEALAAIGGLEIAAMAGYYLEAAVGGATIVLDGFITGAAALIAQHICPESTQRMLAATRSAEPGHGAVLECLGLEPLLDWGLRLGEGTGALLAIPLIDAAAAIGRGMASLEEVTHG